MIERRKDRQVLVATDVMFVVEMTRSGF